VDYSAATRTVELTTTEAAVLSLLAMEGERSGYDLVKQVERSIAHVWSPARSGLYATLQRLARDGLVRSRRVAQRDRPDKQLYRLSREGRQALDAWLELVEPEADDRFFLKLFVGGLTSNDVLLQHVEQFRADTELRLARYRAIEPTNTNTGHDWYHRHLLRLGIARAALDLRWAEEVARALASAGP